MNLHDLPMSVTQASSSPESEHGVLGSMLVDNDAFDRVADLLEPGDFHDARNGAVYSAIASLITSGKPADVITAIGELRRLGLDGGIDLAYLAALEQTVVSARGARQYAMVVAEHALARRLQAAANEVRQISMDDSTPVLDRVGQAQGVLEGLEARKGDTQPRPIEDFVVTLLDRIQALDDGSIVPGTPTRIPGIDRRLGGGLKTKKLIILAARPSVGKSSLAEQVCLNLALDGVPAGMLSMEMEPSEMTDRAVANLGRVDLGNLGTGKLTDSEWPRLTEAVERIRNLPLYFDFKPAMSLQDIAVRARLLKRRYGIKLLVVDYLQLCHSPHRNASRHHQIEEISRGLKALAGQLDITIMVLSQLNREVEKRTNGRPILADLKESGAIEEDADIVMLMWRHSRSEDASVIGLEIAKNRGGPIGDLAMHLEGRYQRWGESTQSLAEQKAGKPDRYAKAF